MFICIIISISAVENKVKCINKVFFKYYGRYLCGHGTIFDQDKSMMISYNVVKFNATVNPIMVMGVFHTDDLY